ncbi:hypothetical protein [Micromonospora sp. GCM10011541]|uniref:hypothetical protein n=1 Tax=Micromonospora sp. GCM10011541 TaxID=3317336 RepID=UPI00360DEC5B
MSVVLYKNLERRVAKNDFVQSFMDDLLFEMEAIASADLVRHHQEGNAKIETAEGHVDRYLILADNTDGKARGDSEPKNTAASIEFGRAGYIDPDTGEVWGAMDGLFILANATNLPKRRKKLKRQVRRRPQRGANGKFLKTKKRKKRGRG